MKKKMITVIIIVVALVAAFLISTGFRKRTDVVLFDYSVSEDGTAINLGVQVSSSMGYVRGFKNNGGGVKPHYLTFYSTFGGLNSSFGTVNSFVLELEPDDTEIYFNRPDGGYELVLVKEEATGEWIRPREELEQWDMIPMVMVNGELYLDTGYKATSVRKCGTMDGEITSEVAGSKQPTENNQSNFGTGYGYQYGSKEGTIEIFMNDQWFIFASEEVRNQIQFPKEEMETIRFHDKVFQKSDLSEETINWLENYNNLSEEEQLSISGIPAELYEMCGYPLKEDMEVNDELPDIEAFVAVNLIKESEKILTVEEGVTIADILEKEEWMEGAPACDNDYKIVINKEIYYYHSECGTFVDTINNRSKSLDEEEREKVNQLIQE